MRSNPVFREGIEVYLLEGHGIPAYFYLLLILAPIEFLTLFLPSLDPQSWTGAANLFKVSAIVALALLVYFGLRLANREFVPWRFRPIKHWIDEQGIRVTQVALAELLLLGLHSGAFIVVFAPLLLWAGAISRTELSHVLATLGLLFFYALAYGVWGLGAAVFWERRMESRQVFVRCFFFGVAVLTALVYLPLNPAAYLLYRLGRREIPPLVLAGLSWPVPAVHFGFHLLLFGLGLAAFGWALRREGTR